MSARCFIAIELPAELRAAFSELESVVAAEDGRWAGEKWVPQDNLHITLKFVGHIAEESVPALVDACVAEIAPLAPFRIVAESIRPVPSPRRARMLWGAFSDPTGACAELAAAAERAALRVGVGPEERAFKPHVTLVRARSAHSVTESAVDQANALLRGIDRDVSVTAATVFESKLGKHGPTYVALATCPLGG